VMFPLLKIKDNAVHAGLSQPLNQWNLPMQLPEKVSQFSQNNNWLTAQDLMVTKDAMVEIWITPSDTSLSKDYL